MFGEQAKPRISQMIIRFQGISPLFFSTVSLFHLSAQGLGEETSPPGEFFYLALAKSIPNKWLWKLVYITYSYRLDFNGEKSQ